MKTKAAKVVRVTCKAATTLPHKAILPYQADLKKIDKADLLKLKRSIVKYGFTLPMAVWKDGEKYRLLDGHQRLIALKELSVEGYAIPEIPVTVVQAKSRDEAKQKLLAMVSVYGKVDKAGLAQFIKVESIDVALVQDVMNIPEVKLTDVSSAKKKDKGACPEVVEEYEGMARIIIVYKGDSQRRAIEKALGIAIKDHVFIYQFGKK